MTLPTICRYGANAPSATTTREWPQCGSAGSQPWEFLAEVELRGSLGDASKRATTSDHEQTRNSKIMAEANLRQHPELPRRARRISLRRPR